MAARCGPIRRLARAWPASSAQRRVRRRPACTRALMDSESSGTASPCAAFSPSRHARFRDLHARPHRGPGAAREPARLPRIASLKGTRARVIPDHPGGRAGCGDARKRHRSGVLARPLAELGFEAGRSFTALRVEPPAAWRWSTPDAAFFARLLTELEAHGRKIALKGLLSGAAESCSASRAERRRRRAMAGRRAFGERVGLRALRQAGDAGALSRCSARWCCACRGSSPDGRSSVAPSSWKCSPSRAAARCRSSLW